MAYAQLSLSHGEDPAAFLVEALSAVERGLKLRPGDADLLAHEAELRLVGARFFHLLRRPIDPELRRIQAALAASLRTNPQRSDTHVVLARSLLLQAETSTGAASHAVLARGLEATGKALTIAPGAPVALLLHGQLLLAQAERARHADRASAAQPALVALTNAVRSNPLLRAEAQPAIDRARALTQSGLH